MKLVISRNGTITIEGNECEIRAAVGSNIGSEMSRRLFATATCGLNAAAPSWNDINAMCQDGELRKHFSLGDILRIKHRTLGGSGNTIDCRIVRICDTGMVLASIYTLKDMQFDAPEKERDAKRHEHPHSERANWGSNLYRESAIHQWLNSDKTRGEWWSAQNKWDNPPEDHEKTDGFLAGFEDDFLEALGEYECITAKPLGEEGESIRFKAKFFLPSVTELTGKANNGVMEGIRFAYADKIAKGWNWLRSPFTGVANYVYNVNTSGALNYNGAYTTIGVAPACVIGKINQSDPNGAE